MLSEAERIIIRTRQTWRIRWFSGLDLEFKNNLQNSTKNTIPAKLILKTDGYQDLTGDTENSKAELTGQ